MSDVLTNSKEIQTAFAEYDRKAILNNVVVGCILGIVLMPVGTLLDYCVYRPEVYYFFKLRLFCSLLIGIFCAVVLTPFGRKHPRKLGVLLAFFPAFFMSWMIYATEGSSSPYYAGLNLVLLVVGFVLHWTVIESLIVVSVVTLMYIVACALHGNISSVTLSNNLYFLILTGIIVATGSYFHSKIRFREFAFRYQLDKNKHALEETNEKLVELDRLKGRFFANISHELRTPLTLLLLPLESLMQRFDPLPDDGTREMLGAMHANGMRLLKLINDLLDLIRLESGRMEVKSEPLVVEDFIKGLTSAVRQVAEDKRIKWESHIDPQLASVLTDRDKVEKIVLNLLFNALKFTPVDGRVELRAEKQGGDFVLIVSDTGVGIAKKSLPFVFDRFWQADSSSKRKFQGVGIGLALVKELVEMMHGSVTVESEEGKGTTFTVRLPYQKAEPPAKRERVVPTPAENGTAASEEWLANLYRRAELFPAVAARRGTVAPVPVAGHRPTVLVAEDEPDMRRFLKTELDKDYDVLEAADGVQALEKALHFSPDIILLDMMMPEMDGLEVCRELRKRETTMNIPVILLTARADEETKFNALEIGANDFLAKPFSSTELQARIKNLIESHHFQRKLSKQNVALTSAIEQIKETESQLVQSEKLASLGRLSAGIIHEINNPLNFTLTGLFALRNKSRQLAPEQRREYEEILDDVEEGVKRVRDIVFDLRTFTHPGAGAGEIVEVPDAARAALRFLSGEWKGEIQIEQNLPPDQIVWANRNKLIHVLVNLLQNSIDALAEKKFADGEKPTIWIEGRTQGDRSLIVVRDNGTGIDPKFLGKIFDPFFTTKEVGKGMGLGLSICYRIVHAYGGRISVRSEHGKNCEFTVDFATKDETTGELEIDHGKFIRL
jgi:signal transduction histidine kinase